MKHAFRSGGWSRRWILLAVFLAAGVPLLAQVIGPYPGGGYPPRGYPPYGSPGGGGIPFPRIPGRGKKPQTDPNASVTTYKGNLKTLDDKNVVLILDDGRTLNMKRTGKTKFYKDSQEVKPAVLNIGDRVAVDAVEDQQGFLYALKVAFEKVAAGDEQGKDIDDASDSAEGPPASSQEAGDGRPKLKRKSAPELENPQPEQATNPRVGPSSPGETRAGDSGPARSAASGPPDAFIEKARAATVSFSGKLPNFICQEFMARFSRDSNLRGWQSLDVISAELIYEGGQESYRNLKIDSRPTDRKIEELSGSWSTGEFATTLNDLFHPATRTRFRFGGETSTNGFQTRIYDFDVQRENSHWVVQMASQSIKPAYQGSVWIDKASGRVVRVEMQARDLPSGFPMDTVESAVDYSFVRIGAEPVLLPVHAESLGCQRGTSSCSHNVIDFRNYRKYTADSVIIFDQ